MKKYFSNYSFSFTVSLVSHVLLFGLLFSTVIFSSDLPYVTKKGQSKEIVQAVTVNQQQVQQEVSRLKQQQLEKKEAQQARLRHLQNLAQQAKQLRSNELKHLHQLKREQADYNEKQLAQRRAAERQLSRIKQQQIAQQQKLENLQEKQRLASQSYVKQQQKMARLQKQQLLTAKATKAKLAKELAAEKAKLAAAKQQYVNGIINKYNALIVQAISKNWITPPNVNKTLQVTFQVELNKNGKVQHVSIIKSSGVKALDQSAVLAVYKASPLPIPLNKPNIAKQFSEFTLTMNPSQSTAG